MKRDSDDTAGDIEIAAIIKDETPNAILVYDGMRSVWIARKLCKQTRPNIFKMPEWLAKKERFI